jgi:hypothetical protein
MVTVKQVIQYNINTCSKAIYELKRNVYAHRDSPILVARSFYIGKRHQDPKIVRLSNIDPRHPEWGRYLGLKKQCNYWLNTLRTYMELDKALHLYDYPDYTQYHSTLQEIQKHIDDRKDFSRVERWLKERSAEIKFREFAARVGICPVTAEEEVYV